MAQDLYCSMIHGGLHLDFKGSTPMAQHCCLRNTMFPVDTTLDFWQDIKFQPLREINLEDKWDPGCHNCRSLEASNNTSFRTGMNDGLKIFAQSHLSGPARIDLMFDISCNLACRTCGAFSSTYWQKHLKEHGEWNKPIFTSRIKTQVIDALKQLDLSNLHMLVFCGGETLLGQEYWDVANWIADNVPNAKEQLTVCFQTNGTQPVLEKNYGIIDKLFLLKLHISLDAVEEQFEYLRWPASWTQVTQNIKTLKDNLPSNVMFVIEETISIFNLAYINRLEKWVGENFTTNRSGDPVNHTRHLAKGIFGLHNLSQQYIKAISSTPYKNLISHNRQPNRTQIENMLSEIDKFDYYRQQSFLQVFPEVAKHYSTFR